MYRRLLARISAIPGIEAIRGRDSVVLALSGTDSRIGVIKVGRSGLECRFSLPKAQLRSPRLKRLTTKGLTHAVKLALPTDLDEELMTWIKAAKTEARTSKGKSSSL